MVHPTLLASPRDVSTTRGYSVLRWALYRKQYETCKFLVYAGAESDYRPFSASDNSPRHKACHFLLESGLFDTPVGALRALTTGSYFADFIMLKAIEAIVGAGGAGAIVGAVKTTAH